MTATPAPGFTATLVGDLVGSRRARDRRGLHVRLQEAIRATDAEHPSRTGLRIWSGDEVQGTYPTVGAALAACLTLRLRLLPDADARFGIGHGRLDFHDETTDVQDGPAWWAAREAIETSARRQGERGTGAVRVTYRRAPDSPGPDPDPVNAALGCQDLVLGSLSDRALRIVRGLREDRPRAAVAEELGVSASAVSQTIARHQLPLLLASTRLLEDL